MASFRGTISKKDHEVFQRLSKKSDLKRSAFMVHVFLTGLRVTEKEFDKKEKIVQNS